MILITGSTGYLGKRIIDKLEHETIIGISRSGNSGGAKHLNINIVDLVPNNIPDQISTIIHTAAVKNSRSKELINTNVTGTIKVIIIYVSLTFVNIVIRPSWKIR